jgi:hypothetical protein
VAPCPTHHLEERRERAEVVRIVFERLADRLAHRLERGEMDHGIDPVPAKERLQCRTIAAIRLFDHEVPSGKLPHPPQRFRRAVAIVVGGHDLVAGLKQGEDGMAANIAGSTGDENRGFACRKT